MTSPKLNECARCGAGVFHSSLKDAREWRYVCRKCVAELEKGE